jgi:hypothetical protein
MSGRGALALRMHPVGRGGTSTCGGCFQYFQDLVGWLQYWESVFGDTSRRDGLLQGASVEIIPADAVNFEVLSESCGLLELFAASLDLQDRGLLPSCCTSRLPANSLGLKQWNGWR